MSKTLKRLFALAVSTVTLVGCGALTLVGCDDGGDGWDDGGDIGLGISIEDIQAKYDASNYKYNGAPVTISLAHHDNEGSIKEAAVLNILLEAFNKRYPTITVELDIISEYEDTYTKTLQGTPHDVFAVPDGAFKKWLPMGKMVNLTTSIANSPIVDLNGMYDSVASRFNVNGTQYVMPRDISPQVMYYNVDYFNQKGVPLPPKDRVMTMDEAVTMWKALTTKSGDTITTYGNVGLGMEGLVWSAGGDFLNPERNAFPTDTTTVEAIKRAYQFVQDAYFTHNVLVPSDEIGSMTSANFFSQQRVATLIDGSWNMASFRNLSFNWDIAYVPAFETASAKNGWSGSVGYAMSTNCMAQGKAAAAWRLIEYIGSMEGQEILSATGFQFPLYESLGLNADYIAAQAALKPANYEVFIKSAMNQPAGTWTYSDSIDWKQQGYDLYSKNLLDENVLLRWDINRFIDNVRTAVNSKI